MLTGEQLTRSLIREYLIRRNMLSTIKQFDQEFQDKLPKITRVEIIRNLYMERLFRINKELPEPKLTLLEMLVDYLTSKVESNSRLSAPVEVLQASSLNMTYPTTQLFISPKESDLSVIPQKQDNSINMAEEKDEKFIQSQQLQNHQKQSQEKIDKTQELYNVIEPPQKPIKSESLEEQQKVQETSQVQIRSEAPQVQQNIQDQPKEQKESVHPLEQDKVQEPLQEQKESDHPQEQQKGQDQPQEPLQQQKVQEPLQDHVKSEYEPTQDQSYGGSRLGKMRKVPAQEQNNYVNQTVQEKQQVLEVIVQQPRMQSTQQITVDVKKVDNIDTTIDKQISPIPPDILIDLDELDKIIQPPVEAEKQESTQKSAQQGKMLNLSRKPASQQIIIDKQNDDKRSSQQFAPSHDKIIEELPVELEELKYIDLDINNHSQVKVREEDRKFNYVKVPSVSLDNNRRKRQEPQQIEGKQLTQIKNCIFSQSGFSSLPKSWGQGFITQNQKTFYGLLQKEGGPCGVIAAVQAYYLKHFLILGKGNDKSDQSFKTNCLVAALADILYKVAKLGTQSITIAVASRPSNPDEAISLDSCDQLVYPAKSLEATYEHLYELKDLFIGEGNQGVTLFFYSVILSKGIETITKEMDNADNTLIGNHGHCTQEMVNLMVTGSAMSNIFDGDKTLDENYVLRGIKERSEFGFLTIFEHFKYMEVGSFLKSPIYPIWIICKEYHYSVVFGSQSDTLMNTPELVERLKQFDLIFYDELNSPHDMIRVTIRRGGAQLGNAKKQMVLGGGLTFNLSGINDELTPSLDLVLRTKWGHDIEVDWNDSMPIL